MPDHFPQTASLDRADQLVVNWDFALAEHDQTLRRLVSNRLSGRGESAVEDVLQEVALAAHATPAGSVASEKVESWLKQVAINKVRDMWRKIERKDRLQSGLRQEGDLQSPASPSPFEWVMEIEQAELITRALNQLSGEEQRAMKMKYLEGQSCGEIAREEGVNAKAVEYRLSKARKTMRSILGRLLEKDQPTER